MEWYKNKDKFTSNERVLLSILTLNEDPKKMWVKYSDVRAVMKELLGELSSLRDQNKILSGICGKVADKGIFDKALSNKDA